MNDNDGDNRTKWRPIWKSKTICIFQETLKFVPVEFGRKLCFLTQLTLSISMRKFIQGNERIVLRETWLFAKFDLRCFGDGEWRWMPTTQVYLIWLCKFINNIVSDALLLLQYNPKYMAGIYVPVIPTYIADYIQNYAFKVQCIETGVCCDW